MRKRLLFAGLAVGACLAAIFGGGGPMWP